jgi:uncharacterized protein YjeT (DUF2065 family)
VNWQLLMIGVALALVIEGVAYALFPDFMKKIMESVLTMPSGQLRVTGLVTAAIGVALAWLAR